ncbi:hypothetical protein ACWEBX_10650 [Streptomyces sp. NPDC005070]
MNFTSIAVAVPRLQDLRTDEPVEELVQLGLRQAAQVGEGFGVGASSAGLGVRGEHQSGQSHGWRCGSGNGQRYRVQSPVRGSGPIRPGGCRHEGVCVEQLRFYAALTLARSRRPAAQPLRVLEFLPRHGMTGETHSAQEPTGQVHLPVAIGAQRALQRE